MTFVLILTLFGVDTPDMTYAVATDMSASDCAILIEKQQTLLEQTFVSSEFELTCETDRAYE